MFSISFSLSLNDDFYKASFEVYYVSVSKKLGILEFSSKIFSFWPWSLPIPPEAKVWASATSMRSQILAGDVSFHMKHYLLDQFQNWSFQRPLSLIGSFWPPPRLLNWPKSPHRLGLNSQLQALQILTNDDKVENWSLSSFLLTVT